MRTKHSSTSDYGVRLSTDDSRLGAATAQPISEKPQSKQTSPIEVLQVQANEERRVSLGSYSKYNPIRGFSIEVDPDPTPADSVHTEVRSNGTDALYELILHITNRGKKTVTAKVWEL